MAKVLSVNSAKKEIEVVPQVSTDKAKSGVKRESVFVQSKIALPACVTAGANIRLWGERLPDDKNTFIATDIRGCRGGGCSDPTGVRSRLSRRGKGYHSPRNDSTFNEQSARRNGRGSGSSQGEKGGSGNGNGGGK